MRNRIPCQPDAGTRLATALRRRPFPACNKGNRRRLHAGNSTPSLSSLCMRLISEELHADHESWERSRLSPWKRALPQSFFAGNRRPEGLPGTSGGIDIQQKRRNDPPGTPPYFFSLFDPSTNTPFYSAYKVTPSQAKDLATHHRPKAKWRNPIGM